MTGPAAAQQAPLGWIFQKVGKSNLLILHHLDPITNIPLLCWFSTKNNLRIDLSKKAFFASESKKHNQKR
jgi:hypothetical protein